MDKALNGLARIAVENAKAIHQRTALGAEPIGIFTLARELAHRETAGLEKPRIGVVGLGEIGLRTARLFTHDARVSLTIRVGGPEPRVSWGCHSRPFPS